MKTVFLDSSVLFSAVYSPIGGSAKLFTLKNFKLITSTVVLAEVERNVRNKLTDIHLERFFHLVENIEIVLQQPTLGRIEKAKKVITEATYIASLDRKHFFTLAAAQFVKPQKIVTPKMILEYEH